MRIRNKEKVMKNELIANVVNIREFLSVDIERNRKGIEIKRILNGLIFLFLCKHKHLQLVISKL